MNLKDVYLIGKSEMQESGFDNPDFEASLLLSIALGIEKYEIYANPEKDVDYDNFKEFKMVMERRKNREPIAYIVGEKEFYSRRFVVTPDVLIPRPETEILVDKAWKIIEGIDSPKIIEIGTGSGCIALTLGCEFSNSWILGTDISYDAIKIARKNAKNLGVDHKILFMCGDMLNFLKGSTFDLVISNPPYISDDEFNRLEADVKDFEPKRALSGGLDGLDCIGEIIYGAKWILVNGGWCILEIGANQSNEVTKIFQSAGYSDISITKDLSGIKRVVKAKWIA
ncbi:MAG: peptide chain release factor N(5)-glutamine methyltransferase [Thermodesulfobacteriota bacterium]